MKGNTKSVVALAVAVPLAFLFVGVAESLGVDAWYVHAVVVGIATTIGILVSKSQKVQTLLGNIFDKDANTT